MLIDFMELKPKAYDSRIVDPDHYDVVETTRSFSCCKFYYQLDLPDNFLNHEYVNKIINDIKSGFNAIVLYGMGGIGKSTLLRKVIDDCGVSQIAYFDLRNKRDFCSTARDILQDVFQYRVENDKNLMNELLSKIKENNILIIFDNLESIMDEGKNSGKMLPDFYEYQQLAESVINITTSSTIIFSGRDKLKLSSRSDKYNEYALTGFDEQKAKVFLAKYKLVGTDNDWTMFVKTYKGNPLSLKIIAEEIRSNYRSSLAEFLADPNMPRELADLLEEQFNRFSLIEKNILFILAVEREPISYKNINSMLVKINRFNNETRNAIFNISNRCFIEGNGANLDQSRFYLQPVIMEFLTQKLLGIVFNEIIENNPDFLMRVPMLDTVARDYIVKTQKIVIIEPLCNALLQEYGQDSSIKMLANMNSTIPSDKNYACGNIINILSAILDTIKEIDFSNKYIINADFRYNYFCDCKFVGSTFLNVLFRQTFGNLIDVRYSHDDQLLIGGTTDYCINIWSAKDLSLLHRLPYHSDWVRSVDTNEKYIASASNDETLSIIDYKTFQLLNTFSVSGRVRKVKFNPFDDNILFSSGDDLKIHIWDISAGKELRVPLVGHEEVICDFCVIKTDGNTCIISCSDDGTLRLWNLDLNTNEILLRLDIEIRTVVHDGFENLYVGCSDGSIWVYSLTDKVNRGTYKEHHGTIWCLDYDEKHKRLVSCSADKTVIVWECTKESMTILKVLNAHSCTVWSAHFNGNGDYIVSTGDDGEVKVWDTKTFNPIYCIKGYTNLLRNLTINRINNNVFVCGDDMLIREFASDNFLYRKQVYKGHINRVRHVDISLDGKYMVSCGDDGCVILWDLCTNKYIKFHGHKERVWTVCFLDNNRFASAGEENDIYLWDKSSPDAPIGYLKGHSNWIWDISFDESTNKLISAGEDGTCRVWDLTTDEVTVLSGHTKWLFAASVSPNRRMVVTASADGTANVFDIFTGEILYKLIGHSEWVWSAIFLSNTLIATGGKDGVIKIWRLNANKTVECVKSINAHDSWVVSLAYKQNAAKFYSASADSTVKVWDTQSFEQITSLHIDKPYENIDITDAKGLNETELSSLLSLGALIKNI